MVHDVVVVGSGVSGLSCAYELARAGLSVHIVARSVSPATTSNVAAAFWYPYFAFPRDQVLSWAARSWHRFAALAEDPRTGVRMADAVEALDAVPTGPPWWADAAASIKRATDEQCPGSSVAGWCFAAPVIDTRQYLPWLTEQVAALGVATSVRALTDLNQVHDELDRAGLIVDCAGLGARELAADEAVHPIRGQLVLVNNPGLTRVVLDETNPDAITYIVPRGDDCVLGGTASAHDDDRRTRPEQRDAMMSRCIALEPRLRGTTVLADVVGLRPGRAAVRLQTEKRPGLPAVVHNYGHGGAGVTLSWGCAEEVALLVAEARRP